ncbi:G-protein beta WD-40 repeats containing protein [Penicillium verhagenii]|nr:G-protein beta WD-40 repeats containing protein [Penicillium verhagenii]
MLNGFSQHSLDSSQFYSASSPPLLHGVEQAVEKDPFIGRKKIKIKFKEMILQLLLDINELEVPPPNMAMVIDALYDYE